MGVTAPIYPVHTADRHGTCWLCTGYYRPGDKVADLPDRAGLVHAGCAAEERRPVP
jgi:hypothetical protein